jgi:hypothetical protein
MENEVALAGERESRLQKDIEDAIKTKTEIENDIDEIRRHKADMLEPQLIAATKELKVKRIYGCVIGKHRMSVLMLALTF